jgi:hypothetical protein
VKGRLGFANFTLRFGDQVLLDFVDEIVIPAFFENAYRPAGSARKYLFTDVGVTKLDYFENTVNCIIGRIVKDQIHKVEQRYDDDLRKIVKDDTVYRSSPTSFFVLMLENHKLIYLPEVSGAPEITAFANTAEAFIKHRHRKYVDEIWAERKKENKDTLRKDVIKDIPYPTLSVVPLSSSASLEDFISQYQILRTVEVQILQTNHDKDPGGVFEDARIAGEQINADRSIIKFHNTNGLDKAKTAEQLKPIAQTGNTVIKTSGIDRNGVLLEGENKEMSLRPTYTGQYDLSPKPLARRMLDQMKEMIRGGYLKIKEEIEEETRIKALRITERD